MPSAFIISYFSALILYFYGVKNTRHNIDKSTMITARSRNKNTLRIVNKIFATKAISISCLLPGFYRFINNNFYAKNFLTAAGEISPYSL